MSEEDFALPPASAVQDSTPPAAPEATQAAKKSQSAVLFMVAVAVVLVALLLGLNIRQRETETPLAPANASVAQLQAEIESQRASLNARRAQLGMPPLAETTSGGESSQEIAARMTRDTASLVAILESLQKIVAEKEKTIQEKNTALLAAEQSRKEWAPTTSSVPQPSAAPAANPANEMMLRKIEMLEKDLAEAQAAITNASKAAPDEDLQRRLEESQRAREFFENRVKELEAQGGGKPGDLPPPPLDQ